MACNADGHGKKKYEMLKWILSLKSIDVNYINPYGDSALTLACFWNDVKTVELLMKNGYTNTMKTNC